METAVNHTGGRIVKAPNYQFATYSSNERQSSPVTGLEWPRGFQEVKVPRVHDNSTGWW
jgi:hypothetical protein